MIAISSAKDGALLRVIPAGPSLEEGAVYGFHGRFGFVSEATAHERTTARRMKGLAVTEMTGAGWLCRFRISARGELESLGGCRVEQRPDGTWGLATEFGQFVVTQAVSEGAALRAATIDGFEDLGPRRIRNTLIAAAIIVLLFMFALPKRETEVVPPVMEPIEVKITPETQRAVHVPTPSLSVPPELAQKIKTDQAKRAIDQNLGFLGMLGRKDLTKALGGMPTSLKNASAGAGAGGTEGSGGELLVGLGQGVKRTTVGNSGVAGLGGIGTKGAGGGAGGYGNSMVGSGEGKALSSVALSKDMVLEGGLDKSVIQATIAKYLSQVRACYETGLRKVPGLAGQVTMAFEVGASGDLNSAKVLRSTLGNAEVEQCISQRMLGWKFPKPLGGVNVKANYPFLLRPVSG